MAYAPAPITSLETISAPYDAVLSDVWGVLHNGVEAHAPAAKALARARADGKAVVLVTNSPRPRGVVERQLKSIGVPQEAYDALVTSGDVTRALIEEGPRRVFHIGSDADLALFDGLDVELVEEFEAQSVVCTGLVDDETEKPEDYAELLMRLRARNLPFVCANPDIVVERGHRLIWCAGALARDYGQLGGRTLIAGKPHRPIYEAALAAAAEVLGRAPQKALAIGDGALTDLKGAQQNGIDVLFITDGIHAGEYGAKMPDPERLMAFLSRHGLSPLAMMPQLA